MERGKPEKGSGWRGTSIDYSVSDLAFPAMSGEQWRVGRCSVAGIVD